MLMGNRSMRIISLISILLVSGCISIEETSDQMHEGASLWREFKTSCGKEAWKKYPENKIIVDVRKSRVKSVKSGMVCEENVDLIGDMRGKISTCKDTYKKVKEYYYVKELVDGNKSNRDVNYRKCLKRSCKNYARDNALAWNPRNVEDTDTKMKYCSGRGSFRFYKQYRDI
tara:strand:- start:219 stop:734 length:516 start_codon:yes stop_codon:yes gene_type:complete